MSKEPNPPYVLAPDGLTPETLAERIGRGEPYLERIHDAAPGTVIGGFRFRPAPEGAIVAPSLKINAEMTDCSPDLLARQAAAERIRYDAWSVPERTVSIEPAVIVIGDDRGELLAYAERMTGLFETEPVLVGQPDDDTAEAGTVAAVHGHLGEFAVELHGWRPVDRDACTVCGICAAVCPEHCIAPGPVIDRDTCTLCEACVNACPESAIDLRRDEIRTITAPLIALMPGMRDTLSDLPEPLPVQGIIDTENTAELIAAVGEYVVEETVRHDVRICQHDFRLGIGCERCIDACPVDAIAPGTSEMTVDALACVDCGRCTSTCPTGAMRDGRFDDAAFLAYLDALDIPAGTAVVIADEKRLHRTWWNRSGAVHENTLFIEHPKPGGIGAPHLLSLFVRGVSAVFVAPGDKQPSDEHLAQVRFVNAVVQELFGTKRFVREFTPDAYEIAEPSPLAAFAAVSLRKNRRILLADLLGWMQKTSGVEGNIYRDAILDTFGTILCDRDACTLCLACVGSCRINALEADAERYALVHTPARCIRCGICSHVCPESCLEEADGLVIDPSFFSARELARDEPVVCPGCGKEFGTARALEAVKRRLAEAGLAHKAEFQHLCADCRAIENTGLSEWVRKPNTNNWKS